MQVAGTAANGREAVDLARRTFPHVILMDIRMPVLDGLDATRLICTDPTLERTRVLVLTTFDLDEYVYTALRVGASGFLLKDTPRRELLRAIEVIAAGDALLSPGDHPPAHRRVRRPPRPPAATPRARGPHRPRTRHPAPDRPRPEQRRDRRPTRHQPPHRQEPRPQHPPKTRLPRPRRPRRDRLRKRPDHARRPRLTPTTSRVILGGCRCPSETVTGPPRPRREGAAPDRAR